MHVYGHTMSPAFGWKKRKVIILKPFLARSPVFCPFPSCRGFVLLLYNKELPDVFLCYSSFAGPTPEEYEPCSSSDCCTCSLTVLTSKRCGLSTESWTVHYRSLYNWRCRLECASPNVPKKQYIALDISFRFNPFWCIEVGLVAGCTASSQGHISSSPLSSSLS